MRVTRLTFLLTVCALSLGTASTALAAPSETDTVPEQVATPPPSPSSAAATPVEKSKLAEITALRVAMHQTAFDTSPSNHAKSDLASALEDAVHESCMPRVPRDTNYTPPKKLDECSQFIDRLLDLVPEHATALCARDGFSSNSCVDAFERQTLAPLSAYSEPKRDAKQELEGKLANTKVLAQVDEMTKELANFKRGRKAPYDEEVKKQLMSRIYAILNLACIPTIIRYQTEDEIKQSRSAAKLAALTREPFSTAPSKKQSTGNPAALSSTDNPFEGFEEQLGIKDKAAPAPPEELKRVRYLPDLCVTYIGEALKMRPGDATATCHREGFQTPRCIRAIERARALQRAEKPSAPSSEKNRDGFSTF